jgi:hypothetical protein
MRPGWLKHGSVVGVGVWLGRGVIVAVGVAGRVGVRLLVGSEVKVPDGSGERYGVLVTACRDCAGRSPGQEVQAARPTATPRTRRIKAIIALQPIFLPFKEWKFRINFKIVAEDLITPFYCNQ